MKEKNYQDIKIEKLDKSRVKISGEVTAAAFEKARSAALIQIKNSTEVPGFRVGKAPEALVIKQVGDLKILNQAAGAAIEDIYGPILDEFKIRAIGQPMVTITKLAPRNPLGFTIETAVMPEVSLENYKKIAKEAAGQIADASEKVEDKEIDAVIDDLRKHLAKEGGKESAFEDTPDFRKKAEAQLIEHKKREVKDKRRAAIADKLIAEAKFEVPEIIIDSELDTMLGQFRADVARNGLTFETYLSSLNKKEADIRQEWRESAERRARLELILKFIAGEEKIAPDEAEVKKEVDHIVAHHKTADRFSVRMYVENMMKNNLVLEFLEK